MMAETMIEGQRYLTTVEVARRIGVCEETIRRWLRVGQLPGRKLGHQYFILEKDLEELMRHRSR